MMFCEYPINPENYIYNDDDYEKILRQKRIVIFDLIPFTVKYKKNLVRYFTEIHKNCELAITARFYDLISCKIFKIRVCITQLSISQTRPSWRISY